MDPGSSSRIEERFSESPLPSPAEDNRSPNRFSRFVIIRIGQRLKTLPTVKSPWFPGQALSIHNSRIRVHWLSWAFSPVSHYEFSHLSWASSLRLSHLSIIVSYPTYYEPPHFGYYKTVRYHELPHLWVILSCHPQRPHIRSHSLVKHTSRNLRSLPRNPESFQTVVGHCIIVRSTSTSQVHSE